MGQLVDPSRPAAIRRFAAAGGLVALLVVPFFIAPNKPDPEKVSAY